MSEARFRAVFDTVLEVLVLMEPDGTIVEMNRKDAPWRAKNRREGVGKKIWERRRSRMYPQHIPLMKKAVKQAAAGKLFEQEVRMEREGAPTAYLDVSVQPVHDRDGKLIYLLFEARDITDLKAAQEQLRQSQKMEALGQLTGGIAHDFNNLLTVVVGGLDIIAKRADDAKLKRYAENALGAAERGARLTAQLLAFSRVQRLEVRPTLVAPLIQNMRPLLRNVLGPGITKEFDLDEAMMPVMADPTQLEVAILNLAINARDAMPDGGVLTFSSEKIEVADDPDLEEGEYIELTISDTGSGMPPEVTERAFEPFFTTKEVGKGTGLGLSMVYGMARQSGGAARIESSPAKALRSSFCSARRRSGGGGRGVAAETGQIGAERRRHRSWSSTTIRTFVHSSPRRWRNMAIASDRRVTAARVSQQSSAKGPTSSSSTSSCPASRAPMSPGRYEPNGPNSRSCSFPATARPTRSSAPRPMRRSSPSRFARTRCTGPFAEQSHRRAERERRSRV